MRLVILFKGREYRVDQVTAGTSPDVIIAEKFPEWIYVSDASTKEVADRLKDPGR